MNFVLASEIEFQSILIKENIYEMTFARDKLKSVLRNFAKFTGKNLCQSLVFNNVTGLRTLF